MFEVAVAVHRGLLSTDELIPALVPLQTRSTAMFINFDGNKAKGVYYLEAGIGM
jgi:hypothetical protein